MTGEYHKHIAEALIQMGMYSRYYPHTNMYGMYAGKDEFMLDRKRVDADKGFGDWIRFDEESEVGYKQLFTLCDWLRAYHGDMYREAMLNKVPYLDTYSFLVGIVEHCFVEIIKDEHQRRV